MFNQQDWSELQQLTKQYSRQLGALRAPELEVGPGRRCVYSMVTHRVTLGIEVLTQASPETRRAILAHEVGHAAEPELQLWHWSLRALPVVCALSIATLLWDQLAHLELFLTCFFTPILLVLYLWFYPDSSNEARTLRLEVSADKRAARLVGAAACLQAMDEYGRLFTGGKAGKVGQYRRQQLELRSVENFEPVAA